MTIAIRTENLSKQYRLAAHRGGYRTFREALADALAAPFRRGPRALAAGPREFWALREVELSVPEGEVLGVVGHNGAGKSTLLKILARITSPTTGRAEIRGRVGSLLEVGTGFHPELSGRENVFLSGAILGMSRNDIRARFAEIVAFSGVESFIDTPIKHYSSGMQLRLAFAVAAHLEPEILLIDEVLAVGDAAFQRKCLGKMKDVSRTGRTVLFVSHNLQAVRALCSKACFMEAGRVKQVGEVTTVIRTYLDSLALVPPEESVSNVRSPEFALRHLRVEQDGTQGGLLSSRELVVEIEYDLLQSTGALLLGFDAQDSEGNQLFRSYDLAAVGLEHRAAGRYLSRCILPAGLLPPGTYYLHLLVGLHRQRWISRSQITLKVDLDAPREHDVDTPGVLLPQGSWQVVREGKLDPPAAEVTP